uniref:Fatty acid amide hydrolase n=1 Tax=Haplochromis burtoni TaxID=8153 RepID=A0A3Q3CYM8_HAPBU
VNKKLNCCTEILLESLDQLTTVGSNKDGLLYGVPVSIKENIAFKNHDCSCGVVINLDQPAEKDSVLVQVLKKQGAIPFVRTNLPQALLNYDCSNPIYGQTVNPHNPQKTSGGSSGGEGALIGGGGSLLGIGTDIGGSIRIPASFCGICGFKPTAGRLSLQGVRPIYRGQKTVSSSPGPMARDVDSLALCMQALLCDHMFSLDPTVPPLPFNMEVCLLMTIFVIASYSGSITPFNFYFSFSDQITFPCAKDSFFNFREGGPVDPCLEPQIFVYRLPKWLKKIISFLLKPVVFFVTFPCARNYIQTFCFIFRSVPELWKQHADYIQETIAHWRSCNIDVLLCPVIGPAYNFLYFNTNYTFVYNLLNFPAGVVTVSTVTAEDEEEFEHYPDKFDKVLKEVMTGGEGLPVAVQCVALPWQDELCLRLMKEVEQLVKESKK